MGKSWLDLVVAEDRPAASAGMQMLHRRGETGWSESRWMGADGMARRVLWNAAVSPQERLIFLTAFDIANLKGDSEGAWEWEVATDELTWSEELYRIAGRDPRLPAPRAGEQHHIYAPESWERLKEAVRRALATGESFAVELELLRPDATSRRILSRGQAVRDGAGRVVRLCGRDMDITGPRAPRLSQVQ
jgi:PAS domain-containing protein